MTIEEAIQWIQESRSTGKIVGSKGLVDACDMAIAALCAQQEADNPKPLTLEELREMGGEPYWHVSLQEDSRAPHWVILDPFYAQHIEDYGYGKRWLAYRHKPKEGTT